MKRNLLFVFALAVGAQGASLPEDPAAFEVQRAAAAAADVLPDTFGQAKNVIVFLGDGMGVSTVTAARILEGQQRGNPGEENALFFESFPYTAMVKTYATNLQTPDSASTMTAIVSGHKTKGMVVGYDSAIVPGDHRSTEEFGGPARRVTSLLERFESEGKATGIVTTTSVTHATPAACYAHSPSRLWECGNYLKPGPDGIDERYQEAMEAGFKDLARQLVEFSVGDGIDVILGGGRRGFVPAGVPGSPETGKGRRIDGRNLLEAWQQCEERRYVSSREELLSADLKDGKQLMGLFAWNHLSFELSASTSEEERTEPALHEMSRAAIEILRQNQDGFFLMIEGGRIDHGHHYSHARLALTEAIEFDRTIRTVWEQLTPQERRETLIVVTADHSHTFTMGGYPARGNPILGKVRSVDREGETQCAHEVDAVGLPFTTLGYLNGGGFPGMMIETNTLEHAHGPRPIVSAWKFAKLPRAVRPDLTDVDTAAPTYRQEAAVPLTLETHSGEDVAVYATGPGAHLFRGTREQNYLYHAMIRAIGNEK